MRLNGQLVRHQFQLSLRPGAMECMGAQQHLWEYYTDLARRRGTQLKSDAGPNLGLPQSTLGEAYIRVFPQVTDRLS